MVSARFAGDCSSVRSSGASSVNSVRVLLMRTSSASNRRSRRPNGAYASSAGDPDQTILLSYGGVNHSGANESAAHTMHADGVQRPVPQAPGVVAVCRWSGPRTLESIGKKDGAVVGHATYEASADGTELTATVKGIDAKGLP